MNQCFQLEVPKVDREAREWVTAVVGSSTLIVATLH